jgi:alpha-galactosidase
MKKILSIILSVMLINSYAQKYSGLALTPPMGWNSWNTFQTNINEDLVKQTADLMVSSGMKDAGYSYIVLDDGWMAMQRDSISGDLVPDPKKFPHGMKSVIDYVHSKGLKFGLYNCAGTKTCAGYPGTRGYEYQDARFYAALGIDYLKFDWCNSEGLNTVEAYTTMSKALKAARRPIIFSLCEWGGTKPWVWAKEVGQLWRTTGDINAIFDGVKSYGSWHANGVMTIVDMQDTLRKYAGPGHWNDPDMLEVGNGMSVSEDRVHLSIWCMLAAPLMMGNDIRKMSQETRAILTNKDVISIDQDVAGIQALRYDDEDSLQTWFKPLKNGDWAVCFINRSQTPKALAIDWKQMMVHDELSGSEFNAVSTVYQWRDFWTKANKGTTAKAFNATLGGHDVILLRMSK